MAKRHIKKLDSICVECSNESALTEFGYCSSCMEKTDKKYDVSPIIIHFRGYAERNRPEWHTKRKK